VTSPGLRNMVRQPGNARAARAMLRQSQGRRRR
jgi:hypothetical protein